MVLMGAKNNVQMPILLIATANHHLPNERYSLHTTPRGVEKWQTFNPTVLQTGQTERVRATAGSTRCVAHMGFGYDSDMLPVRFV